MTEYEYLNIYREYSDQLNKLHKNFAKQERDLYSWFKAKIGTTNEFVTPLVPVRGTPGTLYSKIAFCHPGTLYPAIAWIEQSVTADGCNMFTLYLRKRAIMRRKIKGRTNVEKIATDHLRKLGYIILEENKG